MNTLTPIVFALSFGVSMSALAVQAQPSHVMNDVLVRYGERALTFSSGSIQKTTPRDGIVNLITGDNQTTGNRTLTGRGDELYLKLDNPNSASIGDLFTIYRRVRKVFHPLTQEYLGFITIRVAIVRVTEAGHTLTPVETIISYGPITPGDPVVRYETLQGSETVVPASGITDLTGMIVDLQANKAMTLVSYRDVVYLDRGQEDGLRPGDTLAIYRHSAGLPPKKIGQLKVLSIEHRTATAHVVKATTRIYRGDRYKLIASATPVAQPVELLPSSEQAIPSDLVASSARMQDASGQSRINLGEVQNFLHYESGEAAIKPESYQILDQLVAYLQESGDSRLIRVEGHADNVEIGPSLKSRYPSNWELSKARANGVVRYLVEKGGVDSARLSSVGYGDSKPAASNEMEEGRTKNRRVEILLYTPDHANEMPKAETPGLVQKLQSDPSSLNARGGGDEATMSVGDSKAGEPGTGSMAEPSRSMTTDGSDSMGNSDANKTPSSDTVEKDASQPAGAGDN